MAQPSQPTAIVLAINGLILNPSTFDPKAANGSLTIANNVVIDRPSVVQSRRGFTNGLEPAVGLVTTTPGQVYKLDSGNPVDALFQFNGALLAFDRSSLYVDYRDYFTEPGQNFDEYVPEFLPMFDCTAPNSADTSGMHSLELNKNFYFNTNEGVYRTTNNYLDLGLYSLSTPRKAGSPPGLGGTATTTGISGFLADNTSIAYRIVFGFKDTNNQLVLGAPGSRIIVNNTSGGSANVSVTFQVPDEIQAAPTDYFFQVYRGHASPDLTTEPDDEMALAYEEVVSIYGSVASITIVDITPSDLLGAALYTNQGQDGILQSNYRPPWCVDMCAYKQYAFYANTRTLQNANLTLISAGATNGANALVPGDIVTFTMDLTGDSGVPNVKTFTLTAGATNDAATGTFEVSNTGNPAFDIQTTAINLVNIANTYDANDFLDAYYTSTGSDLPGQMQFVRTSYSPDFYQVPVVGFNPQGLTGPIYFTFNITTSNTASWEQPIANNVFDTTLISTNEVRPNRVYFSKFNQPEAVPIVNYFDVGSANAPIYRIVPLRDGVMVLKADGVFRISNVAAPFTVTPIDYTVKILAPRTAAELDNKVYFLSDQGIVAVTDTDAQIMSFILDKTIIENTSQNLYPNLFGVAWGVAYQSDRKYILSLPTSGADTQAQKQFVYNHLTQCWTNWDLPINCGVVFKKNGKLYLGGGGALEDPNCGVIYQERKSFTNNDYADNLYRMDPGVNDYTVPSTTVLLDLTSIPLPTTLGVPSVGWIIKQDAIDGTVLQATVVEVVSESEYIVDKQLAWNSIYSIFMYQPIHTTVETIQLDCDNPGMNKQFSEIVYMFTTQDFASIDVAISSNTTAMPEYDTLVPLQRGGWGVTPWGPTPWGTGVTGQGKVRRYMPQKMQRAGWVYVNLQNEECFTSFGWSGLELHYKNTSTRQK